MSRRSQVGSIEKTGKWYVVRFWKDVPGQEQRVHASERICPVSGPGSLNRTERRRRALQIVMSSGVNDPQKFAETTVGTTFKEQSERFMQQASERKRRPIKPKTLQEWRYCMDKWLNPNLGEMPLADVHNGALKALVAKMDAAGLSPKSINNHIGLAKQVVGSAKNENGEPLFPRKWDAEFIDLPTVRNQRKPKFTSEQVSSLLRNVAGQKRVLYALLAGTGLRIGEALGLEIDKHISPDCRVLHVRQSVWNRKPQEPKTANAVREVDICPALAAMLKEFIGDRKSGFLFTSETGRPLSDTNVLHRSLHPALKKLGIEQCGFHAFRRFRATFLSGCRVPESLIRFWLGHASKNVTDGYVRWEQEPAYRLSVADSVGLGFELPLAESPIVRNVRRKSSKAEIVVAA